MKKIVNGKLNDFTGWYDTDDYLSCTDEYIFMGERHNTDNFLHCSYIWLPIRFGKNNTLQLEYAEAYVMEK